MDMDERSESLGWALSRAMHNRPTTTSLIVRVSDWGGRATYEWSAASGTQRGHPVISGKDNDDLRRLDEALAEEPHDA